MSLNSKCPLCGGNANLFSVLAVKKYYRCRFCQGVFLARRGHPSREAEKKRYQEHNNNPQDCRYQKFVQPIVSQIRKQFNCSQQGLDFGAGSGPVITYLLRKEGYKIDLYDPFFWPNRERLRRQYDFVFCCEVIEHFRKPAQEFKLLKSLLKPKGSLFCMTDIYSEKIDFEKWYYKDDPTHLFFYHKKSFIWIKNFFNFFALQQQQRLVQFSNAGLT